jgi:FAD synthase
MIKVSGIVISGKKKGSKLGFSTANIKLKNKAESGVYSGHVVICGKKYKSAIFIQRRKNILEAHILGFSGNLYGKEIEVLVKNKIRDVKTFKSDEDLKKQIKKDIKIIKEL